MGNTIGRILRARRQELKCSQAQISENICSQSMLSAIENNRYTPNAELLIALCQRLGVSLARLSLAENYAIGNQSALNDRVVALCNHHDYQKLLKFLLDEAVVESVQTAAQTQSYYYYLAVAQLQGTPHFQPDEVKRSLKLSLASATASQRALTRQATVTLAYVAVTLGQKEEALSRVHLALNGIIDDPFEENLSVVFYLSAVVYYKLNQDKASFDLMTDGIDFITANDSHYMLANSYYLLALIAKRLGDRDQRQTAIERSTFLATLFKESV
ncbi:helix-turn-helix transcriptional regulator [uncultured Secundilactobacillus sp.]|uniref:helix-turn-helix domain-containing protein n=1 Tax=uncultured Secundilactobacillus sp. TaxID=2813935 RepID=UPI00258974F0|nr:helix-turn-helix transcriptional regulator [uncultured Secundilactobacillus sp.]